VTARTLNVRSGPGIQYAVVDRLSMNSEVAIYEESDVSGATWYRIGAGRWVHGGWIRIVDGTPEPEPPPSTERQGVVTAGALNVRARPGYHADNPPVGWLLRGARVVIYEETVATGATWYRIGVNRWVHGGWIQLVNDEQAVGGAVTAAAMSLPVGWVVTSTISVRARPGISADNPEIDVVMHNQALSILETATVGSEKWYRIGADRWVYGPSVGVAKLRARPSSIGVDERWVGVNLREQTVVAYEGDKPVYAALVATGMSRTPTVQGIFRTWWRLRSRKMSGGSAATGGYYNLEEVPWTCYFYGGYALHGAYWHDAFGRPRSHGCVNLSLYDAWWIYQWSEPGGPKSPAVHVYWE
jgi:lipoprotein-anchoring transpeptidase ErfK/SrfK